MKKSILAFVFIGATSLLVLKAQDTLKVNSPEKSIVTDANGKKHVALKIRNNANDSTEQQSDSVKIRVGRKEIIITEGTADYDFKTDRNEDQNFESRHSHHKRFKGHLAAFEMGLNSFANVNYNGYTPNFMDLNQNKSFEVNINYLRYGIALQRVKRNIGLVLGLGLSYNDYRFSNAYTIENDNGKVKPVVLGTTGLSKSKLSTIFITMPLMIEFQIPVNGHESRLYFSGGVIGGLKLRAHTKVIKDGEKLKSREDFNINPFRYGATARMGYKGINIFGTWYFSSFYMTDRGPEMYPFTIGIGLMNW